MSTRSFFCVVLLGLGVSIGARAFAAGVLPPVATPVQREQAQARFLRGKSLLAKKSYDEALAEFRASLEIVASPNTRLEIARCLRGMGKVVAAYAELGRAAVEAKELTAQDNRYALAESAAAAERSEIEPELGFVTMAIQNPSEETKVTVASEEIRRAAWDEPVPVLAGSAEVVVETPGHLAIRRTVTLAAGQKTSLAIDAQSGDPEPRAEEPTPAPEPAPETHWFERPRTWAYVAGGVGIAGTLTFVIGGVMAKSTYDDLESVCHGPCPPDKAGEISSGKTQQTIANVGLAIGLAGLVGGAALYIVSAPSNGVSPAVTAVALPGWIGVRGAIEPFDEPVGADCATERHHDGVRGLAFGRSVRMRRMRA